MRRAHPSRRGQGAAPQDEDFFYAPGRSRIRFATMPSITSDVPPSIELALVRSQARGRAPPFERSLSHSSASTPPADIKISYAVFCLKKKKNEAPSSHTADLQHLADGRSC